MKNAIYISGKITGTTDFLDRFAKAEEYLKDKYPNTPIVNPAKLSMIMPAGSVWDDYMVVSMALVSRCSQIYMLKGWETSLGAQEELQYALEHDYELELEQ